MAPMFSSASTTGYHATHTNRLVVVTGATGYVGGRLISELLEAGFRVRASSRNAKNLERFPWHDQVEVAEADLQDQDSTEALFAGADTVFFLVHSMGGKNEDFEEAEQRTARTVASAAEKEGVRQMVYLSGLHPKDMPVEKLSKHMRSREKVALTFLDSAVPTIVLQAATLIGSGSASYEMIRHLTERLPIMLAPKWINNMIEPISIRDTLYYLLATADLEKPVNEAFDIGCGTQYRFSDLLRLYAKERALRRFIGAVPLSLPLDHLSGLWISLVTPAPYGLAVPLAQSMAKDCVTADRRIRDLIPDPEGGLADYPTSVRRALQRETESTVPTSWDDSWKKVDSSADSLPTDPDWAGHTVFTDERERITDVSREKLWQVIEGIGGAHGWYSSRSLWAIRGLIDKLVGGPGLGGRRDRHSLAVNDRVDWWRVESIERGKRLVLRAEMKASGRAWLVFELSDVEGRPGATRYHQRAIYFPKGLLGRAYWLAVMPFHAVIFPVMVRNIIDAARRA